MTTATAPTPAPTPVAAPTCASCQFWHRSSNQMQDQTCRRYPPARAITEASCRAWPHTLGSDGCGEFQAKKS